MRIENEDLLRIIKEELEGILREAEEELESLVHEGESPRTWRMTRAEKMADRERQEKFYDRPRVEYTDDEKATRAKGYDAGSLATMVMMLQSDFKVAAPQEAYNEIVKLEAYLDLTKDQKDGLSIKDAKTP